LSKKTTYRPSALLLLAILLYAVFGKELHHLTCNHDHGEKDIQHYCQVDENGTYFHEAQAASVPCAICLFHFSPSETPIEIWRPKIVIKVEHQLHSFSNSLASKFVERLLPARAPPMPTA